MSLVSQSVKGISRRVKRQLPLLSLFGPLILASGLYACGNDAADGDLPSGIGGSGNTGGFGAAGNNAGPGCNCAADITSDPENCGACSHGCAGGDCIDGACQALDVITFEETPDGMTIGGDYVVWFVTSKDTLGQVRKDGSGVELNSGEWGPGAVVANNTHVYWTVTLGSEGDALVLRRSFAGGNTEDIAWGVKSSEIALDDTSVYWFDRAADDVGSAGHDGSNLTLWDTEIGSFLQVDAERLFWVYIDDVQSCPKTDCTTVAPMGVFLTSPTALEVDATHVYIANQGAILRADKSAGTTETLNQETASHLAQDDTHIYFTMPRAGEVRRVAKSGGASELVVSGEGEPTVVRVDDTAVFWLDEGHSAIRKIAKPLP